MDRYQSAMQGGGGANAGAAAQEWLYPGGWQPEQLVVVNGAFLMELLEDGPVADQPPEDVDRLSRVIRSLEAEIGGVGGPPPSAVADVGGTADHVPVEVHNVGLQDYVLPDLDPCVAVAEAPLEFWTEVPPALGHDMGGWYVDGDGVMVGYEFREQCYYGYSDSPHVEQVYSPLWE